MFRSVVAGTGAYLPEKILYNKDLEKTVDTNDAWIRERTGIAKRHIAASGEYASDMGAKAAAVALKNADVAAQDIDLIIVATTTPDITFPSTATRVQALLGAKNAAAFDVQAVCAGFIYALSIADSFIRCGTYKTILVIGSETLSHIVDWSDRGTCILFGDGAGAVVLQAESKGNRGILSTHLYSDGSLRDILLVDGGVGKSHDSGAGKIRMAGKEVFKHAVNNLADSTAAALKHNKLSAKDVDWVVPHQANLRIMEGVIKKLEIPMEKLICTVADHANTSAASIPLALHAAASDGRIKSGDLVAIQAIGGGLAWGASLVRW